MAHFGGVHTLGYNSAEVNRFVWNLEHSGVHCLGLALAD